MAAAPAQSTVYFDGACPLCRAEIGYYSRKDADSALCFVDVSQPGAVTPAGTSRQQAMERLHVCAGDGRVVSGAAAFVEIWSRLPRWRWAAAAARLPGALAVLESGYRTFLRIRPFISRLLGRVRPRQTRDDGIQRG